MLNMNSDNILNTTLDYQKRLLEIQKVIAYAKVEGLRRFLYCESLWRDAYAASPFCQSIVSKSEVSDIIIEMIHRLKNERYRLNLFVLRKEKMVFLKTAIIYILKKVYAGFFKDFVFDPTIENSMYACTQRVSAVRTSWFMTGNLLESFLRVSHIDRVHALQRALQEKIDDKPFIFLVVGCLNWTKPTFYRHPDTGVLTSNDELSIVIINILLQKFDTYLDQLSKEVEANNVGTKNQETAEYSTLSSKICRLRQKIANALKNENSKTRVATMQEQVKELEKQRMALKTCKVQTIKRVMAIRYLDCVVIGVDGIHLDADKIRKLLFKFIRKNFKFELSGRRAALVPMKISNLRKGYFFLGYDVCGAKEHITKNHRKSGKKNIQLRVSREVMEKWISRGQYGDYQKMHTRPRNELIYLPEICILKKYNEALYELARHYALASRPSYHCMLGKAFRMVELSFVETIAKKHRLTRRQAYRKMLDSKAQQLTIYTPQSAKKEKASDAISSSSSDTSATTQKVAKPFGISMGLGKPLGQQPHRQYFLFRLKNFSRGFSDKLLHRYFYQISSKEPIPQAV